MGDHVFLNLVVFHLFACLVFSSVCSNVGQNTIHFTKRNDRKYDRISMTEYPKKNNISQNTIFHTLCEITFVKYFAAIITITQDIIQYFRVYFIALKEFWGINDLRPTLYEYKLHSMTKVKELT